MPDITLTTADGGTIRMSEDTAAFLLSPEHMSRFVRRVFEDEDRRAEAAEAEFEAGQREEAA